LLRQNQNVHHFTKTGSGQTWARESTQKESGGSGALVPLCAPYKKEFCVHTTATLERRRVFAVLAFNKDLIGGNADRNLEPCRRYSAAMVAAGGRPPPLDERGLEAASMLYARPAFASIGVAKNENTPSVACPDYSLSGACLGKSSFNLSRACLGKSSLKKRTGPFVLCLRYLHAGLSVGREALDSIVELAVPEYYDDPQGFIARRFYAGAILF
jgi:hypothetical protein